MLKKFKEDFVLFCKSIKELKIDKLTISIVIIFRILSRVLNLVNPLLFGNIINSIINKSIDTIKINLIYILLTFVVSTILNYITSILLIKFTYNIEANIKSSVFASIFKIPYTNFLKIDKGKLINNMEQDSIVFSSIISDNTNVLVNILSLIISLIFMINISPVLTFILILTFPITSWIFIVSGQKIKSKDAEYRKNHDSMISFLNETFYGCKFIQNFNAENQRLLRFRSLVSHINNIQIKKFKIELSSQSLASIITFVITTLNLIVSIYLIFTGKLTLGMLTAFNEYSETFKQIALMFTSFGSTIQQASVSITRVNEILKHRENNDTSYENYKEIDKIKKIETKNLSYSTTSSNKILKDVNINFIGNKIYVIKGESGSGKTTLLNIFSKLIDDYEGSIFVNDINLKCIDKEFLRNKVCYITQDNYLFSMSIRDNISLYRDISLDKIQTVCKKLNIHKTIMSLPNQYDTIINKNGSDLSGGERQRLCIARAMVSSPDIYLLDEITSSIDEKNIVEIIKIIEEISKDSIVILTSHENLSFNRSIIEYHLENKNFKIQLETV